MTDPGTNDPDFDVPPMSNEEATDVVENDPALQEAGADAPDDEDDEEDDDA